MIDRRELLELANTLSLRANVVEKDYVLGWILAGIYRDPVLGPAWVFKGGTCLKKCYFETYRFSEDLDFTITEEAHFNESLLRERFTAIGEWLQEETGIELPPDLIRFDLYQNKRGKPQGEGKLAYRGPLAPRGDLPRIKLDLTFDEKLVLPPATRPIAHAYTDRPATGMDARCYDYPEVFGEKVRALGERARPRDLYDVINLFRNGEFKAAAAVIRDVVTQKCAFKGVPFPTLAALDAFKPELSADWSQMLAHQLPQLPPLDSFWEALPEFFRWLQGAEERARFVPYRLSPGDVVLHGPAGGLSIPYRVAPFMEVIRFAAANQLCVDLDYRDQEGRRSNRLIEPYSLRRTAAGDLILHAVRAEEGTPRSYRLDQIQGATVTSRGFTPRYEIELTPTGLLSAPPSQRTSTSWTWTTSPRSTARREEPIHIYRCPLCDRTFERATRNPALRPHKDTGGWDCRGRRGIYEGTKD